MRLGIYGSPMPSRVPRIVPGIALSAIVGLVSVAIAHGETRLFGHPVIEGLVVAIILGAVVRTLWTPSPLVEEGISFTARQVLEVAVFLLGASVDLPLLLAAGPALAVGVVALVVVGLAASYAIGRALGLHPDLATLVACGNAICGNSAIAAVAPVIDADRDHVASSIAFTAVLGVVVVVALPLLRLPLGFDNYQYGVLAGLTVYAVPQVLAAAFPVSVVSGQVGTLVKLVRVLMLGPVVTFFAVRHRRAARRVATPSTTSMTATADPVADAAPRRASLTQYVPWFILGFLLLAALRSAHLISPVWASRTQMLSGWLTIAAMAALGLGVDVRAVRRVGRSVALTVAASLLVLIVLAIALIRGLAIP